MGEKLRNPPLYFTLTQIQFNEIINFDDYLPALRAKLVDVGFADLKKNTIQTMVIEHWQPDAVPKITKNDQIIALDVTGETSFIIDNNSLTLQTTNYQSFTEFMKLFVKVLDFFNALIPNGISVMTRMGIRYLNLIDPMFNGKELPLATFLIPEVLGPLNNIPDGRLNQNYSESEIFVEQETVRTRVVLLRGPAGFPPDISTEWLIIPEKLKQVDGLHVIVDIDASTIERQSFDLKTIENRLFSMHSSIDRVFLSLTTDEAKIMWNS